MTIKKLNGKFWEVENIMLKFLWTKIKIHSILNEKNLFNIVIKIKCLFTNKIKSNVFTTFIKFIIKYWFYLILKINKRLILMMSEWRVILYLKCM